jgi:Tol biopolymer transport system component
VHESGDTVRYELNPTGTSMARVQAFPQTSLRVWNFKPGKEGRPIDLGNKFGTPVLAGYLNPEKLLVKWSKDDQLGLETRDAVTGVNGKRVPLNNYQASINNGMISPDGRYFAMITDRTSDQNPQVQIYELLGSDRGYRWTAITGITGPEAAAPWGMAFSPDGKKLASQTASYSANTTSRCAHLTRSRPPAAASTGCMAEPHGSS